MNKTRRFLMILLVLALCIGVMFSAIACDPDDADEEEDDNAPTELFTNGNFETTSGDTYPLTPSSWTARDRKSVV